MLPDTAVLQWRISIKKEAGKGRKSLTNERDHGGTCPPDCRADGEQLGIVPIAEARAKAEAASLDLVLIADQSDPVVCKIMDYGKHVFEAKKQKNAQKKKTEAEHRSRK